MIFCSLDINKKTIEEFINSLRDIKDSRFDGVELCLWEDVTDFAEPIRREMDKLALRRNVHGDKMRLEEGLERCREKFDYGLRFSKDIGANLFVTHPIKPYQSNVEASKKLFDEFKDEFLIETVKGIGIRQIQFFNRPIVLDIGNVIKNGEYGLLTFYQKVLWLHLHDFKDGTDHLPIGDGIVDFITLVKTFPDIGATIEIGNVFRKWQELRTQYRDSVDSLNNTLICTKSYGKNVRLKHLLTLLRGATLTKVVEFGCREGYLLHNVKAKFKEGYDLKPIVTFNGIKYFNGDVRQLNCSDADLVICSEVIEHVKEDELVIRNIYNTLRSNGLVFLTTINRHTSVDKTHLDKERGHLRRYGVELKEKMEQRGFRTIAFYPIRSQHYYLTRRDFSQYCLETDIEQGKRDASGWVYFGIKKEGL